MEESNILPGNEHSNSSSPLTTSSPGLEESTEQFLERVTAQLCDAWEDSLRPRNLEIIRLYMAPDFTNQAPSWHENPFPHSENLEDHIAALNALRRLNSEWRCECFNFTASVHEESGRAVVWLTSGPSGMPGNEGEWTTNRESASKLYWRKKENTSNEWECYSHESIRGPGNVA